MSLWVHVVPGLCAACIPFQRVKRFLFTLVRRPFSWTFSRLDCGFVRQDGAGRDPDARWLLRRRDVGTEDARH